MTGACLAYWTAPDTTTTIRFTLLEVQAQHGSSSIGVIPELVEAAARLEGIAEDQDNVRESSAKTRVSPMAKGRATTNVSTNFCAHVHHLCLGVRLPRGAGESNAVPASSGPTSLCGLLRKGGHHPRASAAHARLPYISPSSSTRRRSLGDGASMFLLWKL